MGLFGVASSALPSPAQPATGGTAKDEIRIVELQGTAEVSTDGGANWVSTLTNQVLKPSWHVRTGPNSRVTLRWSDQSVAPFGALTEIEILPAHKAGAQSGLHLIKGILSFFHRDEPGRIRVITRGAVAGVEGTEFIIAVDTVNNTERTRVWVVAGTVQFTNELGRVVVTNGRQAVVEFGQAPELLTAGFIANNVLQWCFYYPAVLDLNDVLLTAEEQQILSESLAAYRAGGLLAALAKYPEARQPGSDAERVYYAALLLSVGQVEKTEATLAALPVADPSERLQRLATALRQLIAAVKRQPNPSTLNPQLGTELLASSYHEQSRAVGDPSLRSALDLAKQAAMNSPKFGFAWARVAELEFSFGHTSRAVEALNKSLELTPRNAQAIALKGFLLAAQNKTRQAIEWFDRAVAVDSALGNAWLGRGLCKIRLTPSFFSLSIGERAELRASVLQSAMDDLLVAAALEPQRALLRSYLGKAYSHAGKTQRAGHEFALARTLDTNDPTPWLYSALVSREENRINEAVRHLEQSVKLNDNRALYRSRFLLDEDRAVRSSSLANVYQSAGMNEVAAREAARAVSYDYANYSAHLFLSESFDALRDPTRFSLRYETPWLNELLLANLLSPVGGTPLSQHISQQEYARLFDRNRIGLSTDSSYRSDGQYRELASQFGVIDSIAWSLDLDYQHNNGVRRNNELDRIEWYSTIKQQLTAQDSVLLLTRYYDYHSGDNFQYFDPDKEARPHYNFDEFQKPIALAGYHREWAPGVHTLALGGFLNIEQHFSDREVPLLLLLRQGGTNRVSGVPPHDITYENSFEAGTAELNQVFQNDRHTLLFGGRYQRGSIRAINQLRYSPAPNALLPPVDDSIDEDFERRTAYAYYSLKLIEPLVLLGGITYDDLRYPQNFRDPPITPGEAEREQIGPKAAVTWTPAKSVTLRGAYSRSLSGVMDDQSFRLEPTQLAGFVQTYRTIIPESVASSISAQRFETAGLALDIKFGSRTYLGLQGERLTSDVVRHIGVREAEPGMQPAGVSSTPDKLDFLEHSAALILNQIVADEWALGLSYRFARSELQRTLPEVPVSDLAMNGLGGLHGTEESDLHRFGTFALFNHPSGFFARTELDWYLQENRQTRFSGGAFHDEDLPGDEFPQFNLLAGYRLPRQRGDITLGVLNVTGEDYHLKPLNFYSELPRERVFYARLRFRF